MTNGEMDNCGGGQRLPPDGDEFPTAYQESRVTLQQCPEIESHKNHCLSSIEVKTIYNDRNINSCYTANKFQECINPSLSKNKVMTSEIVNLTQNSVEMNPCSVGNLHSITTEKLVITGYQPKESKTKLESSKKNYPDCSPLPLTLTEPLKTKKSISLIKSTSTDNFSRKFTPNSDSRHQNDRSEQSVRDKIAMFSSNSNAETPFFPTDPITSVVTNSNPLLFKYNSYENSFGDVKNKDERNKTTSLVDRFSNPCNLTRPCKNSEIPLVTKCIEKKSCLPVFMPPENSSLYFNSFPSNNSILTSSKKKLHELNSTAITEFSSIFSKPESLEKTIPMNKSMATTKSPSLSRATSFSGGMSYSYELSPPSNCQISRTNSLSSIFTRSNKDLRKTRLNQLIEQRKKSISKLRGLVIPEKDVTAIDQPIIDLPEIKSRDSILIQQFPKIHTEGKWGSQNSLASNVSTQSAPLKTASFKMPIPMVLPKYSPAFKRKSSTVCGSSNDSSSIAITTTPQQNNLILTVTQIEGPNSLESICSPTRSDYSFKFTSNATSENVSRRMKIDQRRIRVDYDDSDNDSAVCSSQSSISRGFSPPASPVSTERSNFLSNKSYSTSLMIELPSKNDLINEQLEFNIKPIYSSDISSLASDKLFNDSSSSNNSRSRSPSSEYNLQHYSTMPQIRTLRRSSSTETNYSSSSTLTSGSPTSVESFSQRVLKPQSVEAINRKNILASARCRSGQNINKSSSTLRKLTSTKDSLVFNSVEENHKFTSKKNTANIDNDGSSDKDIKIAYVEMIDHFKRKPEFEQQCGNLKISPTKSSSGSLTEVALRADLQNFNDSEMLVQTEAKAMLVKNPSFQTVKDLSFTNPLDSYQNCTCQPQLHDPISSKKLTNFNEIKSEHIHNNDILMALMTRSRSRTPIDLKDSTAMRSKSQMDLEDILLGKTDSNISRPGGRHRNSFSHEKLSQSTHTVKPSIKSSLTNETVIKNKIFLSNISPYRRSISNDIIQETVKRVNGLKHSKIPLQKTIGYRSVSVTDIKKVFEEKTDNSKDNTSLNPSNSNKLSTFKNKIKENQQLINDKNEIKIFCNDKFGSTSSLANTTSSISQQELAQLVEEASLNDNREIQDVAVVFLHKDNLNGNVEKILSNGIDCEDGDTTEHQTLEYSITDKNGRIKRGDRIFSINGKNPCCEGMTLSPRTREFGQSSFSNSGT